MHIEINFGAEVGDITTLFRHKDRPLNGTYQTYDKCTRICVETKSVVLKLDYEIICHLWGRLSALGTQTSFLKTPLIQITS